MESISSLIFSGFYVFSFLCICWWTYLAYAHEGAGAYLFLSGQTPASFLNHTVLSAIRKQIEILSILICFAIFIFALCNGLSYYFAWIPEPYHLTLGDGSTLHLSIVFGSIIGICSSIVFGRWIFSGICSYWERRALADQSTLYLDIIRQADDIDALNRLKTKTNVKIKQFEEKRFTPDIVFSRLELCIQVIELRIKDIQARQ